MIRSLSVVVGKDRPELRGKFDPAIVRNFERVTGIKKTRRFDGRSTDLAVLAALSLIRRDEFARACSRLIVVTQSQDRSSPCMAVDVHRAIGMPSWTSCFDVNQACGGFIYGLWLASQLHDTMVVCVDKLRASDSTIDSLIFSDAACAFYVKDPFDIAAPLFLTDGSGAQHLCADQDGLLKMDGGKVFDFVTRNIPEMIKRYNAVNQWEVLAQHQPNQSMMSIVEGRTGFSGRSLRCIEEYGNMSMVSIAAAIAHEEEKVLGKKVLLCGYGAGWTAGLIGVEWPEHRITYIEEAT